MKIAVFIIGVFFSVVSLSGCEKISNPKPAPNAGTQGQMKISGPLLARVND